MIQNNNKKQLIIDTGINKEMDSDIKLIKFIWIFYIIQTINTDIKIIFQVNDSLWSILSNSFMVLIMLFLIRIIKIIARRNLSAFVMSELIVLILFTISIMMENAKNYILLDFMFWATCVCIPLGVVYHSIRRKDLFLQYSKRYSVYVLILGIIGFLFMGEQHVYVMSLAYFMLPPIAILINHQFKEFSISIFVILAISILSILVYGARGPLIGIIYIIILNLYKTFKKVSYKSVILVSLITIFLVVSLLFWNQIILTILDFLDGLNIYSRTLHRLAYGNLFDLSGRDLLIQYYIDLVKEKPIFGWGIAGGWLSRGTGPHNAIIELILSFGVVFGGILATLLVFSFLAPFFNKKFLTNDIYTAFAAINLPLLVSAGDIWVKYNFIIYIFILLELTILRKKRILKINYSKK